MQSQIASNAVGLHTAAPGPGVRRELEPKPMAAAAQKHLCFESNTRTQATLPTVKC